MAISNPRVDSYRACATCRKALAWLQSNGIEAEVIDITSQPPSRDELAEALRQFGSRKRLFNTSGQSYRALGAQRVQSWDDEAALTALASDGRLIRPSDEPTTARVAFDWQQSLVEALSRSAELRKQKWVIKQRELELTAARNLLLPRLDLIGRWRFLGMGQDLLNQNYNPYDANNIDPLRGSDAYSTMFSGRFQEWQAGAQFQMPIGFRRELSTVRHFQLSLARERARLQDEELEASHALVEAVRNVDTNFALSQTNFNRRVAAEKQVEAVQAAYDAGTVTLDQLLDAQRRRAEAESSYYRALVDYNRSISQLHFRKGSLLEYNGVFLAEGPWPGKAYFDAHRRARQRDASLYLDYGHSRPGVFRDRKSTRLNFSHSSVSRMPSSA